MNRCHCGAIAGIGIPSEQGMKWFCVAHGPWMCAGCGPEAADEENYPIQDADELGGNDAS